MDFHTQNFVDSLLKTFNFEGDYQKRHMARCQIEDYLKNYRERLIENYAVGDMDMSGCEKYGGVVCLEVGEGDGLVILTKSKVRAIAAFKAYWRDTAGESETPEFKLEDFSEVSVWSYKRPECEGDEMETFFDFASKHPKAKDGFLIYY